MIVRSLERRPTVNKVFRQDLRPACAYCAHGRPAPDDDAVLCVKCGIMMPTSSCRRFKYDPLKRTPTPKVKIRTDYSMEDFSL